MRREWRFSARSFAWFTKSSNADPPVLPPDLIGAFVDRLPIGWRALNRRNGTDQRPSLIDGLQVIERIRSGETPAGNTDAAAGTDRRSTICAGLVLVLASAQTLTCLAVFAGAAVLGRAGVHASRPLLATGFALGAIAIAALAGRDRRTLGLTTALMCVASAFARGSVPAAVPEALAVRLALHGFVPIAFAPAALWQFALAFPQVARFTPFDVGARKALAAAWLLGAVLFGASAAADLGLTLIEPVVSRRGPTHLFWHLFVVGMLPALAILAVRSVRAEAVQRRRIARFAAALAAGGAPLLILGSLRMAIPGVDRWFVLSGSAGHLWIDRAVLWPLAGTPVLSCVLLLVDRPFERQSRPAAPSRARVSRAAISIGLLAPFVVLAGLLYRLRHVALGELVGTTYRWQLGSAGLMSVAALAALCWRFAEPWGLAMRSSDRRRLSSAIDRVRRARGGRETAAVLADEIAAATEVTFGRALLPSDHGAFVDPSNAIGPLMPGSALTAMLRRTGGLIDISERAFGALLPREERTWIASNRVETATALCDEGAMPTAILVFGSRRTAGRLSRRDRWLATLLMDSVTQGQVDVGDSGKHERGDATRRELAFECDACGTVHVSCAPSCGCGGRLGLAALPRTLAGRYTINRRLGSGGMGVVYRGWDLRLRRTVAVKTITALEGRAADRLRREGQAMAALNHDAVATVYGLEFWRGTPVLVEEDLPGGSLAARLRAGLIPAPDAIAIALRLTDALVYMHGRRLVHGDVKPANVAFTADGSAKLLDFGLARLIDSTRNRGGTPDYLPPEWRDDRRVAPSIDLWALSLTFLEMLVGRDAIAAAASGTVTAALGQLASSAHSTELRELLTRALALDPSVRFPTALHLRDALQSLEAVSSSPKRF